MYNDDDEDYDNSYEIERQRRLDEQISNLNSELSSVEEKIDWVYQEKVEIENKKKQLEDKLEELKQNFNDYSSDMEDEIAFSEEQAYINNNNISSTEDMIYSHEEIKLGTQGLREQISTYEYDINFFEEIARNLSEVLNSQKQRISRILNDISFIQESYIDHTKTIDDKLKNPENIIYKVPCGNSGHTDYTYLKKCSNGHPCCDRCVKLKDFSEICPVCGVLISNTNYEKGNLGKQKCPNPGCNRNDYSTLKTCPNGDYYCDKCDKGGFESRCPICNSLGSGSGIGTRKFRHDKCSCGNENHSGIKSCSNGHQFCNKCGKMQDSSLVCPKCYSLGKTEKFDETLNTKGRCPTCTSSDHTWRKTCENSHVFCSNCCSMDSSFSEICPKCKKLASNMRSNEGKFDKQECGHCGSNTNSYQKKCTNGHLYCNECGKIKAGYLVCPECRAYGHDEKTFESYR